MVDFDAVWRMKNGSLELVARSDDPAPGTLTGVHDGFREFYLNASGRLVFLDSAGIWEYQGGEQRLIAGAANAFPTLKDRTRFSFINGLQVSSGGHVAFTAEYLPTPDDPSSGYGVWLADEKGLRAIALAGEHPPGVPADFTFEGMGYPSINAAGQVAFYNYYSLPESGNGIWATDRSGALQLIVRTGDVLEAAPGDFRTVDTASFQNYTSNDDGRPGGFNDRGQLVFWVQFTDGSEGIFVSNAVAVPEPSSFLAAAAILALTASSRLRFSSIWPHRCGML
jgi:hypothetical protein